VLKLQHELLVSIVEVDVEFEVGCLCAWTCWFGPSGDSLNLRVDVCIRLYDLVLGQYV
jgi:hypothetical protein